MNFESIENLCEEETKLLYDDNADILATWFGTYCKNMLSDSSSRCSMAHYGRNSNARMCVIACDEYIQFSFASLTQKCNDYCGANTLSQLNNTGLISYFTHGSNHTGYTDCHFYTEGFAAFARNDLWQFTYTFGHCYAVR